MEQHWCRHYTGILNRTCDKGRAYSEFGDDFGIALKLPCLMRNKGKVEPCPMFALLTKEEMAEMDRRGREALIEYLATAGIRMLKEKPRCRTET